jgi:hypothetical protein
LISPIDIRYGRERRMVAAPASSSYRSPCPGITGHSKVDRREGFLLVDDSEDDDEEAAQQRDHGPVEAL